MDARRVLPLPLGLPTLGDRYSHAEAWAPKQRLGKAKRVGARGRDAQADPRPCRAGGGCALCRVPGQGQRQGARPPAPAGLPRGRRLRTVNQPSLLRQPCRRALTSPSTSDSEGRTGRKAGPRAVRHWTVNVGSGVTDRTGCRDIFNGTDFKAAGHPGKEGVVRPSDGEEKGG